MFKSSIIVMTLNMLSRILGLFREIIIASFFGVSGYTDAYFASAKISNFFTTILGEGALGTVFIPIYNEIKKDNGREKANEFTSNLINIIISISFSFSIIIFLASKFILKYFLRFNDNLRLDIANNMLKIMAFYLIFISISGLMSSLLNSYNKFFISTLVGIIFNLTMILGTIILNKKLGIYSLSISFLFSGLFQVLVQIPEFLKIIKKHKLIFNLNDIKIKEFVYLMIPTLIGLFAYQINEIIDTSFAASLEIGTISSINYASRLYLLPIGVFAISLSVVIFPNLSKSVIRKEYEYTKLLIERGLNILAFLIIPSSFGLIYYSTDIINMIFKYGKFNENNVKMTSEILIIYSIGLIFFSSIHLLTRSHYSFKDRKLPVISAIISIIINILLDYLLFSYKHIGLTIATVVSAIINFLILFISLNNRYIKINLIKYIKFIIFSIINSSFSIFVAEKLIYTNNKFSLVLKLIICIISYMSIMAIKFLINRGNFFDK